MSLMFFINMGASSEVVRFITHDFYRLSSTTPVYSGLKVASDGNLYARQSGGGYTNIGSWLLNGAAGGFYVSRTIDLGTLTTDAGAGPLVCSTDREYDVQRTVGTGAKTTTVTFQLSNDISGSPVLATKTYVFTAEYDKGL